MCCLGQGLGQGRAHSSGSDARRRWLMEELKSKAAGLQDKLADLHADFTIATAERQASAAAAAGRGRLVCPARALHSKLP